MRINTQSDVLVELKQRTNSILSICSWVNAIVGSPISSQLISCAICLSAMRASFLSVKNRKLISCPTTIVNPAYTSQDCSNCGTRQVLKLSDRIYSCEKCKLVIDRDLNASKNILRIGTYSLGLPEDLSKDLTEDLRSLHL